MFFHNKNKSKIRTKDLYLNMSYVSIIGLESLCFFIIRINPKLRINPKNYKTLTPKYLVK
jgi:hypothetical protein